MSLRSVEIDIKLVKIGTETDQHEDRRKDISFHLVINESSDVREYQ